jgi:pyridoxamine 5'-phosphate oxidase
MTAPIGTDRRDYTQAALDVEHLDRDPLRQFERWMREAYAAGVEEPNAMALATVGADAAPSCRIVLLRAVSDDGFAFYTNYDSRKGTELSINSHASLLFFWSRMERQIRIEGVVRRLDAAVSDAYFASRPRDSQLGAWASPQSEVIADRAELERRLGTVMARFPDAVERPPNWGGFSLRPSRFEFWQGRASRLHDRLIYRRSDGREWMIERLAP